VRDLVELTGCGEFAVTTTLAHLVQRGLLHVKDAASPDHVSVVERRMSLLASVESAADAVVPAERQPEPEQPAHEAPAARATGATAGPGSLGMTAAAALAAARAAQGLAQPGVPGGGQVSRPAARREVVPPRPEPFLPGRRPDHPEPVEAPTPSTPRPGSRLPSRPASGGGVAATSTMSEPSGAFTSSVGGPGATAGAVVEGATARAWSEPAESRPASDEALPEGVIERDPGVNRSLLLRLIAGVRGL
jgi:hypothetical protein